MKNREQQILSELKTLAESLRIQLERVDALVRELDVPNETQSVSTEIIDIDIDLSDDAGSFDVSVEEVHSPVLQEEVSEEPEPLFEEPAAEEKKAKKAIVDVMENTQAWRTDMPGSPVKDLMSAISLNDRVLFINRLFSEDHMAFQQARARINEMQTLDEVVAYVNEIFPHWDMDSQLVYRFMMAVRRKVR